MKINQYKIIMKSMMDGKRITRIARYKNDKEAWEENKGTYGLEIWRKIS